MAKAKKLDLTLEEKVSLLYGDNWWHLHSYPKKGVPAFVMHDGPLGLRNVSDAKGVDVRTSEPATCYPSPALLACSFDPKVTYEVGKALGNEAIMQDTNMVLMPGVNTKRNPLCGRNFEYLSEDPYLSGKMAAGYINGIQSVGVGACIKHFAVNSQEKDRMVNDSIVDTRALQEIYLKAFKIAIEESHPWAIMNSYNLVNGIYASDNEYLLKETLRDTWKYDGVVISDWGACNDPVLSHNHGMDIEMPVVFDQRHILAEAYNNNELDHEEFEKSTARILKMIDKGHYHDKKQKDCYEKGHLVARNAARESMVLLKNANKILPLSLDADFCVIGRYAKHPRYQGAGSSIVNPMHLVSFLEALDSIGIKKEYAAGFGHKDADYYRLEAVQLAKAHKYVVMFLGLPEGKESEGYDRNDMKMKEEEIALFHAVSAVNKNMILVLSCGAPIELPFVDETKAVLLSYLSGEAGGEAIADILFGAVSPSGRLAETWPKRYGDVPNEAYYPGLNKQSLYKDSIYVGYRYYETAKQEVRYPFGYGLSYAKFSYGEVSINKDKLLPNGELQVSIVVENVSDIDSKHVLQLYRRSKKSVLFRPTRELIAFRKEMVPAHSKKKFVFDVSYEDFAFYDVDSKSYQVEGGTYVLEVGENAHTIVSRITVDVVSTWKGKTRKSELSQYYLISKNNKMNVSDTQFETLLGREIPELPNRYKGPFTLNSNLEDMSKTWIGKKALKIVAKQFDKQASDPANKKMLVDGAASSPLRASQMGGVKKQYAQAIVDMANGHPFVALHHALWGIKKKKQK